MHEFKYLKILHQNITILKVLWLGIPTSNPFTYLNLPMCLDSTTEVLY